METEIPTFKHWCIVELMGHVKIAGLVTEVELFGSKLGRCEIPNGEGFVTQFFNGSSVYRITPVEEKIARHIAASNQPEPVNPWELKRLNAAPEIDPIDADYDPETDDDDEPDFDRPF